jgi:hypothetical protein
MSAVAPRIALEMIDPVSEMHIHCPEQSRGARDWIRGIVVVPAGYSCGRFAYQRTASILLVDRDEVDGRLLY